MLGLVHGILLTVAPGLVFIIFLAHTGAIWQFAGALGEDNTRDELKRAQRRGKIWGWQDNIELANGDIDHLVLTASGPLALDTKWHAKVWDRRSVEADADRATVAARKARFVLKSLGHVTDVQPLVVVWGRAQHDIPSGGTYVSGTHFVAGKELLGYMDRFATGPVSRAEAQEILAKLRAFHRRVNPAEFKSESRSTR